MISSLLILHFFHLHTPLIQYFEGSYPLPNSEVPISQVLTQLQLPRKISTQYHATFEWRGY